MLLLIILFIVAPALTGWLLGREKGHPVRGLAAGLFLSWLGVLAVRLWQPSHEVLVARELQRMDAQEEARRLARSGPN